MLKRILASSLFLIAACGAPPTQSAELIPYIQQFNDQYGAYYVNGFNIDIQVVEALDNVPPADPKASIVVVGECIGNRVQILRKTWSLLSDIQHKSLVFHELGHCVFKRVHINTEYPDGCPTSIMSTLLMSDRCAISHSEDILAELPHHEQ